MAMGKNGPLGLVGLILLAVSLLFSFFYILAGVSNDTPFGRTYFLQADTSSISGARDVSQWTYFYICGENNENCSEAMAAMPFGKAWEANADNVPDGLGGSHGGDTTSNKFYYLWRFGWVFLIITLFFEVLAFFSSFLAFCGRLGSAIAFAFTTFALFCYAVGASLTTATFVLARNRFQDADLDASLGRYGFGFLWGSFAALLIADVLFGAGMGKGRESKRASRGFEGRRVKDDYS